jgi:hypothetical protein
MSNELTEAERAATNAAHWYCHHDGPATGTDSLCQDCENVARAITAAVAPIIRRETLDRFGDRMGTISNSRPECPDLFCTGWKDSGICPNEPLYRHNP